MKRCLLGRIPCAVGFKLLDCSRLEFISSQIASAIKKCISLNPNLNSEKLYIWLYEQLLKFMEMRTILRSLAFIQIEKGKFSGFFFFI